MEDQKTLIWIVCLCVNSRVAYLENCHLGMRTARAKSKSDTVRPSENKILKKDFFLKLNNKVNTYFMSKKTAQGLHSSPKATVCVIWESTAQGKGCSFSFLHIHKNVQSRIYLVFKELPCMDQKLLVVVQLLKNMWSHKNKCKSQMTWNISLLPPSPTPPLSL